MARNINGDIKYFVTDHLHSTGMFVDKSGTVLDDNDFYPWGGVVPGVGQTSSNNTIKFTGQYRDGESQLDYFGARYYSNVIGRFMSPDWAAVPIPVPYADLHDPQSLNLYAYVGSNPMSRTDKGGHDCRTIGQHTWCWNRSEFQSLRSAEDAHEAKHREDNKNDVDQPAWKKEQRGFAAERPTLEKRLAELDAKEKKSDLTDDEKKEKGEINDELVLVKAMTEGPEADRTAQRYYRDNQNWLLKLFIPNPDNKKDNKTYPPPEGKKNCIGCEPPPQPEPPELENLKQ